MVAGNATSFGLGKGFLMQFIALAVLAFAAAKVNPAMVT
jgi:hypothetical protein